MSNNSISVTKKCLLLLEKCKNMKQLKQAHGQATTCGLGYNSYTLSRLMAFCSDPIHGSHDYAWKLFKQIHNPTLCICNTMIKALLLQNQVHKVFHVCNVVLQNGMYPDDYTLPYLLKACAKLESLSLGESVHGCCLKLGFVLNTVVGNSLISLYSGFGFVSAAREVFDEMTSPCAVSWTLMISGYARVGDVETARLLFDKAPVKDKGIWGAMISGYVQYNCFKEALYMFRLMQLRNIVPDEGILVSVLSACAQLGALDIGIWVHRYLERLNFQSSIRLNTCLVDMYAKCGNLGLAKRIFDGMIQRDNVSWNVMIFGFAMHGDGRNALNLFAEMEIAGFVPDDITFMALLAACSYSGLSHEGLNVLERMYYVYCIEPKTEHYVCIVDLLSRSGLLEEANRIVQRLPRTSSPNEEAVAWRALLSACCHQGQTDLAEVAAERLIEMEGHSGVYVLLSNMYLAAGKYDDAKGIRKMMRKRRIEKTPGCSLIRIDGIVHEFVAGKQMHSESEKVESVLNNFSRHMSRLDLEGKRYPSLADKT